MRHRRSGRKLGRTAPHRKALLRNMACSLILTEREDDFYEGLYQADGKTAVAPPARKGRIETTLPKAKELRGYIEKCITIAKKALPHEDAAAQYEPAAERNSSEWDSWRKSDEYLKWNAAIAPAVTARRRAFALLRDKEAVDILFSEIAPRFADRPGGYTRVLRLANRRLGDAGQKAILEFVGINDRVRQKSQKPAFEPARSEPADELAGESVGEPVESESPPSESAPSGQADADLADGETKAD